MLTPMLFSIHYKLSTINSIKAKAKALYRNIFETFFKPMYIIIGV